MVETEHQRGGDALVARIVRVMFIGAAAALAVSFVQAENPASTVLGTYLPIFAALGVCQALIRSGRARHAAWVLTVALFVLVSTVVFVFGGLMGNNAVAFILVVMVAGTSLGGRVAIWVAGLAAAVCGMAGWAEVSGRLPPSLAPVTVNNAWIAITVTLILAALLHHMAVRSIDAEARRSTEALHRLRATQQDNETRAHFAGALTEVAERALSATRTDAFFGETLTLLKDTLGADTAFLLAIGEGGVARVIEAVGFVPPTNLEVPAPAVAIMAEPGRLLGSEDDLGRAILDSLGSASRGGGVLGVQGRSGLRAAIGILTAAPRVFSGADLQLLVTAAGIVGSVLERDAANERAERAQKLEVVGRLATGVAHDFNNLLSVMMATSEELRHRHSGPVDGELLDGLDHACERATLLTRQLLAFSRKQVAQPARLDLVELIAAFAPSLRRLVGDAIVLETELPKEPLFVDIARGSFEQIVLNLVVNAQEAMPEGGRIVLIVARQGNEARFSVQDTGVGMDDATCRKVFDPFFTTKPEGTGLGLATVSDIAHRFGGRAEIESSPGAGTTLTVRLPISDGSSAKEPATASPVTVKAQRLRVLLSDDHDLVRISVSRLLERLGHEVVAVASGAEALDLLSKESFGLLVTDVAMPEISGVELVKAVDARGLLLPVVMISGHVDAPPLLRTTAPMVFIAKPFTMLALREAIDAVVTQKKS